MSETPSNPMRAAQANMRQRALRRFYRSVDVRQADDGRHVLTLDGRGARTPAGKALAAASRELMLRIADEWRRQGETVDPADMPSTRLLNAAVDGVAATMAETRADILRYAGSDLLCYRAETPEALAERQAAAFDPILEWAAETLGARFAVTAGVMHLEQPPEALAAIGGALASVDDPAALAALSAMTTLTGSTLLALSAARGFLEPGEAWAAAHIDEDFQTEQWGVDDEARTRRAARWREFEAAAAAFAATPAPGAK
jgi:chaperone required for assembly of F1-ATPase